ncbi:MAG: gliding motility-associated C-terminal domain-containing protein, partial [Bacteroidota bacterium]
CPPPLTAFGECESQIHTITVTRTEEECGEDTDSVTVWFATNIAGPYEQIRTFGYDEFDAANQFSFERAFFEGNTFAGCYVTTATDTLGNESEFSDPACVNFCPRLIMANVFSPNDDGINDVFIPVVYQDVVLRDFQVFDRWGRKFHTETGNLQQLWNGQVDGTNNMAREGVYYYYIRYEELDLSGNRTVEKRGWVMLVR